MVDWVALGLLLQLEQRRPSAWLSGGLRATLGPRLTSLTVVELLCGQALPSSRVTQAGSGLARASAHGGLLGASAPAAGHTVGAVPGQEVALFAQHLTTRCA